MHNKKTSNNKNTSAFGTDHMTKKEDFKIKASSALIGLATIFLVLSSNISQADEAYFNANVVPQLAQHTCATCHVGQYIRPRVFEYRELLPYLAMGTARDNNVLIAKMTNARHLLPDVASHPGGQKCSSKDVEPCATFMKWWDEEFKK
ncbi:hypothetical protein M2D07_015685 [Pseudomonas sp. BGr12]|uniref:hypothetical protein n=1 Tax=Pseudomonas sp. BGr12 TaxID=2936269 RepID=UPI002559F44D|nr:hypothetical protein [Pseudomonas sp. BJa5]MDL2428460.1 hypothetical protein [Pseudomonas sp. BJa5]